MNGVNPILKKDGWVRQLGETGRFMLSKLFITAATFVFSHAPQLNPIRKSWNPFSMVVGCICLLLSGGACTSQLDYEQYLKHIENSNNGWYQEKKIGTFTTAVQLKPSVLLAYQELDTDDISQGEKEAPLSKYSDYLYFQLSYSADGKEALTYNLPSFDAYSKRINILSFRMRDYVAIVTDENETILLSDSFFERTYGIGNSSNVLLVFNQEEVLNKTAQEFSLIIKDIGFGDGGSTFDFQAQKIKKPPILKL